MPSDDMMPIDPIATGIPGAIYVEGWDRMVEKHPTRAATLQALANLQLRAILENQGWPNQLMIVREIIDHGLVILIEPESRRHKIEIKISPTSQKEINRHINSHLIPGGYIVTREDYDPNTVRGRGGPSAPWQVTAISKFLRDRLNDTAINSK